MNLSFDDFSKLDIRVGEIRAAERVPETDKLLKLTVDLGETQPRQIISGIARFVHADELPGKQCLFAANLEPRLIKGLESQGMILAVGGKDDTPFTFLIPETHVPPGTRAV